MQMHDMVNALHHIRDLPSVSTSMTDGQGWWRVVLSNLRRLHSSHFHRHLQNLLPEELISSLDQKQKSPWPILRFQKTAQAGLRLTTNYYDIFFTSRLCVFPAFFPSITDFY